MFSLKPISGTAAKISYTSKNGNHNSSLILISCRAINSASVAMGSKKKKKSNLYKLLSLDSEKVGFDEIKKAYRSMALRYHPDVCADSSTKECSTNMFVQLHQAYVTLSDPSSRKAYDMELLSGEADDVVGVSVGRRTGFARETWEAQLEELVRRSESRGRARSCMHAGS